MQLTERICKKGEVNVKITAERSELPFYDSEDEALIDVGVRYTIDMIKKIVERREEITLYDAEKHFMIKKPYRHHVLFGWRCGDKVNITYRIDEKKIAIKFKCKIL